VTPRTRFAHVSTLDGLRGLSVLGPLMFHARAHALPGGFLTIDVFFVLSSYLIVSIALNEWDRTDGFNVLAYAGRRARRLLPALYVCCAVLAIYLAITAKSGQIPRWTGSIVSSLAYVANWHEIFGKVSYFEQFSDPSPVYHTWSLAIEEQFYVVVPIMLILALRRHHRRGKYILGIGAVVAAVASALWMAHLYNGGDPSRVYYGTDTRAQGLLIGIALAVGVNLWGPVRTEWGRRACIGGAYVGAAYVVYAVFDQSQSTPWLFERGGFLVLALAASLIVLGVTQPSRGPLHRALDAPPARALGRVTYGVYLYHWPIFLLVITPRRLAASAWWTVLALALTIGVAAAAYVGFERPIIQRRWPLTAKPAQAIHLVAAGGVLLAITASALAVANVRREDDTVRPLPIPVATNVATGPSSAAAPSTGSAPTSAGGAAAAVPTTTASPRPLRVLVIGDSVMLEIGVVLEQYAAAHPDELIVYSHTHLGCPIVRGGEERTAEGTTERVNADCNTWAEPATEAAILKGTMSYPTVVDQFVPDVVLGLITPWDVNDRRLPGSAAWQHIGEPAYDALARAEYHLATQTLAANGAHVLWLLGPHLNRPLAPQNDPVRIDRLNDIVRDAIADQPLASVVDYPGWLGLVGTAREQHLRDDGVHLSEAGLAEVVPWLVNEVLRPTGR
jgi:peptidoglycan/LPS O-acetylase OafA/YrhL